MKRCKFHKTAHRYVDGLLSARESEAFETHLDGCGRCRTLVEELMRLNVIFERKQRIHPSPVFRERVLHAMAAKNEAEKGRLYNNTGVALGRKLVPVAACLCLMLGSLVFYLAGQRTDRVEPGYIAENVQTESGANDFPLSLFETLPENEKKFITGKDLQAIETFYEITMAFSQAETKGGAE